MKTIALVGNPNTGKTTLFNSILKANEHIGNWHGVTVDSREKTLKKNGRQIATITDLPGTYSLSPFSYEEEVTRNYLLDAQKEKKDLTVLNIIDGNCLERNLLLTFELVEMGFEPIVCINMANELQKRGVKVDTKKLAKELGTKVYLIDAQNRKQVKAMFDDILHLTSFISSNSQRKKDSKNHLEKSDTISHIDKLPYLNMMKDKIDFLLKGILNNQIVVNTDMQKNFNNIRIENKQNYDVETKKKSCYIFDTQKQKDIVQNLGLYKKIKLLELDEYVWDNVSLDEKVKNKFYQYIDNLDIPHTIMQYRFEYIKSLNICQNQNYVYGKSKLDSYVLNKFLAIPIFLMIVLFIFVFTFGKIGTCLTDTLSQFFENLIFVPMVNFVSSLTANLFVINFFKEAICGSVGAIISFLPQIILMYLGLYLLEDSGYMSRLAFTFEDYLKKVGLSGKSIFTLLMCFGCSTTASLTSRNLENKNSKIKTALLTPYISCTAKLPIYSVVCGAFFPQHRFLVIISLYFLGIFVALFVSYLLNKRVLKSNDTNFILEMPPYRLPNIKMVFKNVLSNTKEFMIRAGSVLLGFSCLIWIVQNCNFRLQYNTGDSILSSIAKIIAPIFEPVGFGSAGVVATLLCGIVAKEIIVSTIGILNGLGGESGALNISKSIASLGSAFFLTKASGLSFLVFATLYLPCISTTSVLIKEIGKKWTYMGIAIQFVIAYILSFVTYRISTYFLVYGFLSGTISLVCFCVIVAFLIYISKILKRKDYCRFCPKHKSCKR